MSLHNSRSRIHTCHFKRRLWRSKKCEQKEDDEGEEEEEWQQNFLDSRAPRLSCVKVLLLLLLLLLLFPPLVHFLRLPLSSLSPPRFLCHPRTRKKGVQSLLMCLFHLVGKWSRRGFSTDFFCEESGRGEEGGRGEQGFGIFFIRSCLHLEEEERKLCAQNWPPSWKETFDPPSAKNRVSGAFCNPS